MAFAPTATAGLGVAVPIHAWQVQSAAATADTGAAVSRPGYRCDGWLEAPARSTVMAAMLANGAFPDIFYSTNMRDEVDESLFKSPWWYRSEFTVAGGGRTLLRLDGVIHKAELWVNGVAVAGVDEIAGAYPVHTFDVSRLVARGLNALALRVHPGHPMTDLSIGWVDWNPVPPDANMGVWRDVVVLRTGDVRLADPHVRSSVSAALDHADLIVTVDVENAASVERVVTVAGSVVGGVVGSVSSRGDDATPRQFGKEVRLSAGERRRIVFTSKETPALAIADPALWWPVGLGDQPLHDLRLTASVDGLLSDQCETTFGIREVVSTIAPGGGRQFRVNGRPVQVLGGGWSPDIFLRHDYRRLRDELSYVLDLGLNAVRLEGKLENPEFFDLTDELGIMVLPGWECCDKWESHAGTGGAPWSEQDFLIARRSMASEARLLRNHASVVSFQIGSDFAPPPRLADVYVNELKAAEWTLPIVSSGASEWNNAWASGPSEWGTTATEGAGPSGMKMWPYDWVPPVYWYGREYGAAVGFDSECSAGHSIPRLPSLRKMLSPGELEALWAQPQQRQYHAAPPSPFDNVGIFSAALASRYGEITGLRDFVRKAQLANYEMVRAQFEAYRSRAFAAEPATGVIYWMLNNAWPSLNWHLYDYYLDPAAAYFAAKKANEPLHALFAYDTGEVLLVNATAAEASALQVEVVVRDVDGAVKARERHDAVSAPVDAVTTVCKLELPPDLTATYFVELTLRDGAGSQLGRNVYWLSTKPDVVDWEKTFWQHSPQSSYADLTELQGLPVVRLDLSAASSSNIGESSIGESDLGEGVTTLTLRNDGPAGTPAVGVHASIVTGPAASPVAPVLWSNNDVTLFAGQSATLTARYSTAGLAGEPLVHVEGFNVAEVVVR